MTPRQIAALRKPLARAYEVSDSHCERHGPWTSILTINK